MYAEAIAKIEKVFKDNEIYLSTVTHEQRAVIADNHPFLENGEYVCMSLELFIPIVPA